MSPNILKPDHTARVRMMGPALRGVDALLVMRRPDVRWLTGFTGSSGAVLLFGRGEALFLTDFRYKEQAVAEVGGAEVQVVGRGLLAEALGICKARRIKTLGFDPSMSYAEYEALKTGSLKPVPVYEAVVRRRACKDASELAAMTLAVRRAERAFRSIKPRIKAGVTERAVAQMLEAAIKAEGSARLPFESIVASGPNSSRPHAAPTGRKIMPGDLLTIDWGAEARGYFSDMTRTFLMKGGGKDLPRKKMIHDLVRRANRAGVAAVGAGVTCRAADAAARRVIGEAGYAEYFGHGTGHGVGLEVHEIPSLSPRGRGALKQGMVVTVEPGVYIPGLGGVRIEDMVVVGASGESSRVLTGLPRGLQLL